MQKKILGIMLVLCMLLSVLMVMPASAAPVNGTEVELTSDAVVYVKESIAASGDGSSPDTAFKTLTEAYQALATNGGTIVICDTVTLTYNAASGLYSHLMQSTHSYYAAPQCGGPVKVTSKYGSYDFTATAVLGISLYVLRNDHIFDDIKIENMTTAGGFSALGNDLTIGENVTCVGYNNGGQYPMIHGGLFEVNAKTLYFAGGSVVDTIVWKSTQTGYSGSTPIVTDNYQALTKGTDGDNAQDIVVNGGTWRVVRGGNFRTGGSSAYGYLDHTLNITINGGTFNPVMDNIQSGALMMAYSSATGNSNFTINGGTFNGGAIYLFGRNGVNTQKTIEGNHTLTINGGTFNDYCLIAGAQATGGASSESSLPTDTASVLQASGANTIKITDGTFGENVAVKATATGNAADVCTGTDAALDLVISKAAADSMGDRVAMSQFSSNLDAGTGNDYCVANGHTCKPIDTQKHVCIYCSDEADHSSYVDFECPDCGADQPIIELTITADSKLCVVPGIEYCDLIGKIRGTDVQVDFDKIVVTKEGDDWVASNIELVGADKDHYVLASTTTVLTDLNPDYFVTVTADGVSEVVYRGQSFTAVAEEAPEGYEYLGWYLGDSCGTTEYVLEVPSVWGDLTFTSKYESNTPTPPVGPVETNSRHNNAVAAIAIAMRNQRTAKVTFKSNGAKLYNVQTVKANGILVLPEAPTKDGYIFAGWYKDINGTKPVDFTGKLSGDITLYAKWVKA